MLLETFTTKTGSDLELPDFLTITREVTEDREYSMFHLSAVSRDSELSPPSKKTKDEEVEAVASGTTCGTHERNLITIDDVVLNA